ncbi:MAG: hypothetical protein RL708_1592 [Bacteroidota bacterium]|jgi:hypothetical protein
MENKIKPKLENANVGFHYTVTDEQIEEYSHWTIEEKFKWLFETSQFIYEVQTPEERERMYLLKGKNTRI